MSTPYNLKVFVDLRFDYINPPPPKSDFENFVETSAVYRKVIVSYLLKKFLEIG